MELETIKILIEAAKNLKAAYSHDVWSTLGAYVIAIGWLLTSQDAREYLSQKAYAIPAVMALACATFGLHWLNLIDKWLSAKALAGEIAAICPTLQLNSEPLNSTQLTLCAQLSKLYLIPMEWPIFSTLLNGLVLTILLIFLKSLSKHKQKPT